MCDPGMSSLGIVKELQTKQLMLNLLATSKLPKTLAAFSSQLEPTKIIHFFKCTESSCDYSTDDDVQFMVHLSSHQEKTFSCSYCDKILSSEARLVKHLVRVHSSCNFQCPLCFYRSCSKMQVIIHTLAVHRSKPVRWYLCKAVAPSTVEPLSKLNLSTKFYECGEGCLFSCLTTEVFLKHLSKKHGSCQQHTCHVCLEKVVSPDNLIEHYVDVHSFHFVQCLYCSFGRKTDWDVLVHVAEKHANKPFKILFRTSEPPEVFKNIKALSEAPSLAGTREPQASIPVQPVVKSKGISNSASEQQLERGSAAAECTPIGNGAVLCGLSKCDKTFPTVVDLLKHLTEDHPVEVEFSCPQCCWLNGIGLEDLITHIVDTHTDLTCCPYKKCVFVSKAKQAIDEHMMQVHQSLRLGESELPIVPGENQPLCRKQPECPEDGANHLNESRDSAQEMKETETEELYNCSRCYMKKMKSQEYFRHLSFGHGFKFFCGHCDKGYKSGKLLLIHHEKHHPGLPASVKSYEQNKLSEVSPSVLSGLEEKLQRSGSRKAKTMDKANDTPGRSKDGTTKHSNKALKKLSNLPVDKSSTCSPLLCRKKRLIVVLSSDSEDDVPLPWQETISYYNREMEHVDYDNTFVRLQEGNVRVPYYQLASILKLQPVVSVQDCQLL